MKGNIQKKETWLNNGQTIFVTNVTEVPNGLYAFSAGNISKWVFEKNTQVANKNKLSYVSLIRTPFFKYKKDGADKVWKFYPKDKIMTLVNENLQYYPQACQNNADFINLLTAHAYLQQFKSSGGRALFGGSKRDSESLLQLFDANKAMLPKDFIKTINANILIKELLVYHDKITKISDWDKKLAEIANLKRLSNNAEEFHSAGFPLTTNACYMYADATKVLGSRDSLEQWLYSFWLQRYKQGIMDAVANILKMTDVLLN